MPKRKEKTLEERLHNYCLFMEWLKSNSKVVQQLAYKRFVEETGITV